MHTIQEYKIIVNIFVAYLHMNYDLSKANIIQGIKDKLNLSVGLTNINYKNIQNLVNNSPVAL